MREPGSPILVRLWPESESMTEPTPHNAFAAGSTPDDVAEPIVREARARRDVVTFRAPPIGLLKVVLVGLFLLGALTFMAANVLHPGRAQRLRNISASGARLESMMLSLEHDNERLMSELHRLERGAQGWQSLARKEYGMLLEGEYVYRFPPDQR